MANISPAILIGIADRVALDGLATIGRDLEKQGTPALGEIQETMLRAYIAGAYMSGVATCYRMQRDGHNLAELERLDAFKEAERTSKQHQN
jgi:hypothetical protein